MMALRRSSTAMHSSLESTDIHDQWQREWARRRSSRGRRSSHSSASSTTITWCPPGSRILSNMFYILCYRYYGYFSLEITSERMQMSDFPGISLDFVHKSYVVSCMYRSSFNIDEVFCYTYLFNLAYPGISQWLSPDKLCSNMDLNYVKFDHWSLL